MLILISQSDFSWKLRRCVTWPLTPSRTIRPWNHFDGLKITASQLGFWALLENWQVSILSSLETLLQLYLQIDFEVEELSEIPCLLRMKLVKINVGIFCKSFYRHSVALSMLSEFASSSFAADKILECHWMIKTPQPNIDSC